MLSPISTFSYRKLCFREKQSRDFHGRTLKMIYNIKKIDFRSNVRTYVMCTYVRASKNSNVCISKIKRTIGLEFGTSKVIFLLLFFFGCCDFSKHIYSCSDFMAFLILRKKRRVFSKFWKISVIKSDIVLHNSRCCLAVVWFWIT